MIANVISHKNLELVRLIGKELNQEVQVKALYTIESSFFKMHPYISNNDNSVLVRIKNNSRVSELNLTNVSPYILLFFDEQLTFKGSSFSINTSEGKFVIQTQFEYILFLKLPHSIILEELHQMEIIN